MLRIFVLGVMLSFAALLPRPASAFSEAELRYDFDARPLSVQERRFLQLGLAFSGDYRGLLDGSWGSGSQRAFEAYVRRIDPRQRPENWLAVTLAVDTMDIIDAAGWAYEWDEGMGMSLLLPTRALRAGSPSQHFSNLEHVGSSLSYSFRVSGRPEMARMHDFTLSRGTREPYIVGRDNLRITATTDAAGVILYTRSDRVRGAWSTIMLSAASRDAPLLYAVAGSITPGRTEPLELPLYGHIATGIRSIVAFAERNDPSGPALAGQGGTGRPEAPRTLPGTAGSQSSGTGFLVSGNGHVLTNAHVVAGCSALSVGGRTARVLARDATLDLALLQTGERAAEFAVFAASPARLNADVSVAGYPLHGLLSDLNVTRGSITAVRGLGGDRTRMQISAPVQPGNSGGPVLSAEGTVVGVVVAKLDAGRVAEITGDIPQNVNFAVRGETAQLFLTRNGVTPATVEGRPRLEPEDLAQRAAAITRLVECY